MPRPITLDVTSPTGAPGPIEGFRFLWAFYVAGYAPTRHCQACFRGRRVGEFSTGTAMAGRPIHLDQMDRYPYVYVCGVGRGPKSGLRHRNLHFPLRYEAGAVAEIVSYDGYTFRARDAVRLEIPELPAGWEGLSEAHTRCKNFRFAVEHFGHPAKPSREIVIIGD